MCLPLADIKQDNSNNKMNSLRSLKPLLQPSRQNILYNQLLKWIEFYTFHDIFFFYNKIGNNFQACNNDMYISSYNWNVEMFAWF